MELSDAEGRYGQGSSAYGPYATETPEQSAADPTLAPPPEPEPPAVYSPIDGTRIA